MLKLKTDRLLQVVAFTRSLSLPSPRVFGFDTHTHTHTYRGPALTEYIMLQHLPAARIAYAAAAAAVSIGLLPTPTATSHVEKLLLRGKLLPTLQRLASSTDRSCTLCRCSAAVQRTVDYSVETCLFPLTTMTSVGCSRSRPKTSSRPPALHCRSSSRGITNTCISSDHRPLYRPL